MRPIRTVETNFTYVGGSPEVADLPGTLNADNSFTAIYDLTDAERELVAAGGQVAFTVCQHPIPPIAVDIVKLEEAEGETRDGIPVDPEYRCRAGSCGALYTSERAIELDFRCGHCGGELRLPGAAD